MIICNCRGIGEKAVQLYFKDQDGKPARLKDLLAACQKGASACCKQNGQTCNAAFESMVNEHNNKLESPACNPTPIP